MQFDNYAVGQTIRSLRKAKGISQDVLSGFAGIARTHLSMIENGTKQANFETIWKIAGALEMQPSELVAKIEETIEGQEKLLNKNSCPFHYLLATVPGRVLRDLSAVGKTPKKSRRQKLQLYFPGTIPRCREAFPCSAPPGVLPAYPLTFL